MRQGRTLFLLFLLLGNTYVLSQRHPSIYAIPFFATDPQELLEKGDTLYREARYADALPIYNQLLGHQGTDQPHVLKKLSLTHAGLGHAKEATDYIETYFMEEFNPPFLLHEGFDTIRETPEFKELQKKYLPRHTLGTFFYLYVALIGLYIAVIVNFNKEVDPIAKLLISGFIFIHSFFIFHICLSISNYQYEFPHSYLMSTSFSFLYGPLLYFYFKRITEHYTFKKKDLLHLVPTILFLVYIIPYYTMSGSEKLALMLANAREGENPNDSIHLIFIVILKLSSLVIYGYFIGKIYLKSKDQKDASSKGITWRRNIYRIHILYILSYAVYGILISHGTTSGFFYHFQILSMALMVLYIGYSANVQPSVFSGTSIGAHPLLLKYKKSGLTESLSIELKYNVLTLFNEEKIYKENDLSLETLAKRLNTTRHNTSQVINEHFGMNFHELVNKYRIQEAKEILDNDHLHNLNIIDIAYEVGYNNKVTFNKAFKKDTHLTPSQYQKSSMGVPS